MEVFEMRPSLLASACIALLASTPSLHAAFFVFDTDPFAGSDALVTPGRQVVGGEPSITFSIASDVFVLDPAVFGVDPILFANGAVADVPATGANTVVLQTVDNDGDPTTPFNAGTAANLIADRITSAGPGFFIYFNSGLDLPRLVYSTDLSDPTADLKVLARLTNLAGQPGTLPLFTEENFSVAVPEPATLSLVVTGALLAFARTRRIRRS